MRRTPFVIALYASVLAILGGASVAFVALDKTVTVDVDGSTRHVRTFAGHVGDTLKRAGIPVGAHDAVAPDASAPVKDGSRIVVRHGRQITLSLNGKQRTVWVTALSVDEALGQLGLRAGGAWVSASRSESIGRDGLSFAVRTPQRVTVLADGRRSVRMTTAPTVKDFLAEIHLRLGRSDKLSVPLTLYPTSGTVVQVTRISHSVIKASQAIPFRTITRGTSELYQGQSKVADEGTAGLRQLTWRIVWRDGKVASRSLVASRLIASPHPRIVYVGTKVRPAPPAPATNSPSADGLNWPALANCESGGDPRAVSSGGTYRGLYQFTMGTWQSVGGSGDPIDASSGEQTYRAQILYKREGTSPWPVCGHYLYS